jgi:hypothetical protein
MHLQLLIEVQRLHNYDYCITPALAGDCAVAAQDLLHELNTSQALAPLLAPLLCCCWQHPTVPYTL